MNKPKFLWGVATSAYQSEGGYNGLGQPQNNWAAAERSGEVAVSGPTAEFWTRYEEDFAACERMGLAGFRLGIEWSRVQPLSDNAPLGTAPPFDETALDHYAAILAAARRHGLEPVVTLHHFVHPAWLGTDPWLAGGSTVEHFERFVRTAVEHINRRLVNTYGVAPVQYYVTINEPNMLVVNSYIARQFPIGENAPMGLETMVRAYDTILAAHVRAYDAIHELHAAHGWPVAAVSLNTYCSDVYWLDKFLLDILCVRQRGIAPGMEGTCLREKSVEFQRAFKAAALPLRRDFPYLVGAVAKRVINRLGHRLFATLRMPLALDAMRNSAHTVFLDYIALDYYDPFFAHLARLPDWSDLEYKSKTPQAWLMATVTSKWWDWRVLPSGMEFFCRHYSEDFGGLPVLIAENGLAVRCKADNARHPRRDRMTRSDFLRLHVAEIVKMRQAGVPVFGYLHWSLFDNYEWGSFTPRFGLFSLDYTLGTDRLPSDPTGESAAETYAALIKEAGASLNEGEGSPLTSAYLEIL